MNAISNYVLQVYAAQVNNIFNFIILTLKILQNMFFLVSFRGTGCTNTIQCSTSYMYSLACTPSGSCLRMFLNIKINVSIFLF